MRSRITSALAVAACTLAFTSPVFAQGGGSGPSGMHLAPGQWAVDGSIGFAVPVGTYGTGLNTGLDLMGAVEYHPPTTGPIYFRGEVGYSDFGYSAGGGSSSVLRIDADGLYDFPMPGTPLKVYALAGVGLYHVSASFDLCGVAPYYSCSESSTGFGINFGGGVRYPINPVQLFFELRYQLALTAPFALSDAPYFPFQFGVRYLLPR
jgi:Outer membrane protein beta-barrel domain